MSLNAFNLHLFMPCVASRLVACHPGSSVKLSASRYDRCGVAKTQESVARMQLNWRQNAIICYMAMDQYLYIPFLGEWTSINPSYFDVNRRGTIGFDTLPYSCTAVLYTYMILYYLIFSPHILTISWLGLKSHYPWKSPKCPSPNSVLHRVKLYASSIRQHVLAVESLF